MNRGQFVTLEGGEGVGKTTQIGFIKHYLVEQGIDVVLTREPGGTVLAEKIRDLLLENHAETLSSQAELLMMFAARAQHLDNVIWPALRQGQWVVCDRFTDASYAYQGGGRGMALRQIQALETMIQGDFRPDLTLLLDAPVAIGLQRAKKRGPVDRFESEQFEFFDKVRQAYLSRAQQEPQRIRVIDAARPLEDVKNAIIGHLAELIETSR